MRAGLPHGGSWRPLRAAGRSRRVQASRLPSAASAPVSDRRLASREGGTRARRRPRKCRGRCPQAATSWIPGPSIIAGPAPKDILIRPPVLRVDPHQDDASLCCAAHSVQMVATSIGRRGSRMLSSVSARLTRPATAASNTRRIVAAASIDNDCVQSGPDGRGPPLSPSVGALCHTTPARRAGVLPPHPHTPANAPT